MLLILLTCAWFSAQASVWAISPYSLEYAEIYFEHFIEVHNRTYIDEYEKQARFQIFKDNLARAMQMNEEFNDFLFGITQFMDLTLEEFHNLYTGLVIPDNFEEFCRALTDEDIPDKIVPESFDWRDSGVVTPVRNQMDCGSCYAFSAAGNIESQFAKKHKELIHLSPQQIVDCDDRSSGCQGGLMSSAFRSLIAEDGMETEADYPYVGVQNNYCQLNVNKLKVKLTDCISYNLRSQEKLKQLLYLNGPISIAVRSTNLHGFKGSRIFPEKACAGKIDHAVLLVGYGTENGVPYWIIKNSWGTTFGDEGYFKMQRGEGLESCGMMTVPLSTAVIE